MQLWRNASKQFVITPELLPEQRSLLYVVHYEYDADILSQGSPTWCPRAPGRLHGPRGSPAGLFWQ